MQMVKKIFIVLGLGWFAILLFMPKQELYYKLEQELAQKSIKINEKEIDTGLFSLTLHQADIYVKGIKIATAKSVEFFTVLFYSSIRIDDLVLDDSLKAMAPTQIDETLISYKVWDPMDVAIEAKGPFGSLDGKVNIGNKNMRIDFDENSSIENLKPKLQQDNKGWYYEKSF
ncbi:MAG: hypothetical protein DSZ09_00270 [Sulfurovum sp.]|nr:MAG: hypothetical protein DSZ08_01415 [Sulfurovum sp.]RUM73164.1 MAG: hypothetical protein DSZ09_00270 [Sulfurovum sp.]